MICPKCGRDTLHRGSRHEAPHCLCETWDEEGWEAHRRRVEGEMTKKREQTPYVVDNGIKVEATVRSVSILNGVTEYMKVSYKEGRGLYLPDIAGFILTPRTVRTYANRLLEMCDQVDGEGE